jgi:AcrR family transcriptional regulator
VEFVKFLEPAPWLSYDNKDVGLITTTASIFHMRTCDPKRGLQILDAAAQLFAKYRYHEVRMDDIAEHAGVAKGTLYRYYRDKEDIYVALTKHGIDCLCEQSHATIVGPGEPDVKLHAFITNIVRFYEQYPYFLELIQRIETSSSSATQNALQEIRSQFYHLVAELIVQFNRGDQESTHNPQLAALALMGTIRGILRFTPQPWPENLADWIYHHFKHGLSQPAGEPAHGATLEPVFGSVLLSGSASEADPVADSVASASS